MARRPYAVLALLAVLSAWPRIATADPCKPNGKACATNVSCCSRNCAKPVLTKGTALFGTCCPAGRIACGTTCVDVSADPDNCGGCDHVCSAGQSCIAGVCVRPCVPSCANMLCGDDGCGGSCGTCDATQCLTCMSGSCGSMCAAGEVCSLGACVTTTTTTTASTTTTVNALTPSLTKAFNQTSINSGGTAQLTFTVTNPAGSPAVSDVGFTDTLPPGLRVADATVGGTCANAAAATLLTADSVTVTDLQVPQGATLCTVVVDVTNAPMQTGTCPNLDFTNTASNISGLHDVDNDVTDSCLTVTSVTPSLTKQFSQSSIASGGTAQLTFTVTNPAGGPAVSDVGFTDTLSPGLRVADATVGGTCVNAAAATLLTAGSVTVTNLQVPQGPTLCTVVVDVTNAPMQTGTCPNPDFTNTASNISGPHDVDNDVTDSCLTIGD